MCPSLLSLIFVLMAPVAVFACEKDCQDGVTHAFLGNYTGPVLDVLASLGNKINEQLIPPQNRLDSPVALLEPIIDAYDKQSFAGMGFAMFPSFFHGKCQQNGVDPEGCPNPDCPVVCGTPGSMAHYYPTVRYIAYNYTLHLMKNLTRPESESYKQVEQLVLTHGGGSGTASHKLRTVGRYMRSRYLSMSVDGSADASATPTVSFGALQERASADDVKAKLQEILKSIDPLLLVACGGTPDGKTNGLPKCSWEKEMKEFILRYP